MSKVIFHVDLNSFFASAETLLDPSLKDKPIAVAHDGIRSVVSTASYTAREYGVKSGMSVIQAKKLCPDLIIVEHHFNLYKEYSNHFIDILKRFTPIVEQVSIDEAFCDMTQTIKNYKKPLDLAIAIQDAVKKNTNLDCSIGIAPNKFLAKMASDMKKPRGITILRIKDVPYKLWPLPIKDMQFIGKKTYPLLNQIGIETIGDLANFKDISLLKQVLGNSYETVINHANGYGSDTFNFDDNVKSMSQVTTLTTSLMNYSEVKDALEYVANSLSQRLYQADKMGYIIGITIRYDDFKTITKQTKLSTPIYSAQQLLINALKIFDSINDKYPIRLIGIFLNNLVSIHHSNVQLNLFNNELDKPSQTMQLINDINKQFANKNVITTASQVKKKDK